MDNSTQTGRNNIRRVFYSTKGIIRVYDLCKGFENTCKEYAVSGGFCQKCNDLIKSIKHNNNNKAYMRNDARYMYLTGCLILLCKNKSCYQKISANGLCPKCAGKKRSNSMSEAVRGAISKGLIDTNGVISRLTTITVERTIGATDTIAISTQTENRSKFLKVDNICN